VQKAETEPPGLGFVWEGPSEGGRGWTGVQYRWVNTPWVGLVHVIVRSRGGGPGVQKAETKPPGLGFVWESSIEGGRG